MAEGPRVPPLTDGPARLTLSPTQRKRLDAAADIRSHRPDRIDFLHTVQCQCGIPYGNPGDAVREWERRQGHATLRMEDRKSTRLNSSHRH